LHLVGHDLQLWNNKMFITEFTALVVYSGVGGVVKRRWNWRTRMFQKKILSRSPRIPSRWSSRSETSDLPSRLRDFHKVENTICDTPQSEDYS